MTEFKYVSLTVEDGVATIMVDHPPVNSLSAEVIRELREVVARIKADRAVKAAIITGAGRFFIAGADLREIAGIADARQGAELARQGERLLRDIELLEVPVIAAINGTCLGGGTELALACHLRIAGERSQIGQPEVNLGIIPGFGGTQRLPRVVGSARALEMILTGDPITGAEAKAAGLALENRLFGEICETRDMREGVGAFLEKRRPKFTDQ
ncbi:MAG TPA: enoyl-CoA hydratase-related protein [Armatimonadota bacterium]|nr:enoyl-CoA hydratase-related protein [Armatimonadota bacterium]